MHCVKLADLAAVISQHGQSILHRHEMIAPEAMTAYWAASRTRFSLWHQAIARHRMAQEADTWLPLRAWWRGHLPVLEEVLVSEILTRVVAVVGAGIDDANGTDELSPITHAVHLTHLEARNRVLSLILDGRGASVADKVRLNRLRQGAERWTDTMVGRMSVDHRKMIRYSIDPVRALAFAEDCGGESHEAIRTTSAELMNAAMHDTLKLRTSNNSASPNENRKLSDTVLAMLSPVMFDGLGLPRRMFSHRIETDWESGDQCPTAEQLQDPLFMQKGSENARPEPSAVDTEITAQRWYQ